MEELLQNRVKSVRSLLDELVPDVPVPLEHHDAYTLLIAVLLSAQCTDARVNQVTPELFGLASNPSEMTALGVEKIEEIIRPCGLSNVKSKSIWALSDLLTRNFGGTVPDTLEALESLPGVGHKTASVVMVQAFGIPAFPVDTHIFRLATRWGLSAGKSVEVVEKDLKDLIPEQDWGKVHLQMIYYGRQYCKAKGHKVEKCPICLEIEKIPIIIPE